MKLMDLLFEGEDFNDVQDKINEQLDVMFEKDPEGNPFDSEGLLTGTFKVSITWEPF